jgi:thioredoxin 1
MIHHPRTNEEYEKLKTDNNLIVVKFSAEWCGPCQAIAPEFKALAKKYADAVTFVHVDVEELDSLHDGEDVRGLPTFMFFKDGELIDRYSGANVNKLRDSLKEHAE